VLELLRIAMGVLGWTPEVALAADPLTITLAYEGWEDQRFALERSIFGAQGIKLDPRPPRGAKRSGRQSWDSTWRNFTKEHNARWRARERAERRASAKTARPVTVRPR
jgi:hypothetical protein